MNTAPAKIVVVGGSGYLGGRAVAALRRMPDTVAHSASRTPDPSDPYAFRLDVADPSTFEPLRDADVVVDVANSSTTRPFALAEFCVRAGVSFLSASSDRTIVHALIDRFAEPTDAPGRVVVGAGIFTGLSNLLARAAARRTPACTSLDLGISTSPFSGAGRGTVALMTDALGTDTVIYRDGIRVLAPPVSRGVVLPFPAGPTPTLLVPFPETEMLHASTGIANVRTFMAPRPGALRLAFLAIPTFLVRSRAFRGFLRAYFSFLRRVVFRSRATGVQLVAVAHGPEGRTIATLQALDGMGAGGLAIAAQARRLATQRAALASMPRGALCIDDVLSLDDVVADINHLATPTERVDVRFTS